jgi:hypothetical protein
MRVKGLECATFSAYQVPIINLWILLFVILM